MGLVSAERLAALEAELEAYCEAERLDLNGAIRRLFDEQCPDNDHIRAKIRQQLQVLRDGGLIEFCGGGSIGCGGSTIGNEGISDRAPAPFRAVYSSFRS